MGNLVNTSLGYAILALFVSLLDRYFSGENYKKGEWINGKSFKAKFALSIVIAIMPYFFTGFFYGTILYTPCYAISMVIGFAIGERFLRSYDWAFRKPGELAKTSEEPATIVETAAKVIDTIAGSGSGETSEEPKPIDDDPSRKSVVEAIGGAGANIKDGLKSLGEGIAKASENIFKGDGKKEKEEEKKKDYEPNKNLDDKLKNY